MSWSYFIPCSSWENGTRWRWFPPARSSWSVGAGTQTWFRWCWSMLSLSWTSQRQPPFSGQTFHWWTQFGDFSGTLTESAFDPSAGTARASRWPHATVWPPRRAGFSTMFPVWSCLLCFILSHNLYLLTIILSHRVWSGCGFVRGSHRLRGLCCGDSAEHREAVRKQ